jgi:hypothetical protein
MGGKTSGSFVPFSKIEEQDGVLSKQCSKCLSWKPVTQFSKNLRIKSGLRPHCKSCDALWEREHRLTRNAYHSRKRAENIEERRAKEREYYHQHKEQIQARPCYKNRYGVRDQANLIRWKQENAIKRSMWRKEYRKDPFHKISLMVSLRIRKSLHNGKHGRKLSVIFNDLGYTIQDLKRHLEGLFQDGMNWGNYGFDGWHIDHKIPIVHFGYKSLDDDSFKKCWSLDNLQPLWKKDNLLKGRKISWMGTH